MNHQIVSTIISECLKLAQSLSANFALAVETDSGGTIWFASGGTLKQKLMEGTLKLEEDDSIFAFTRESNIIAETNASTAVTTVVKKENKIHGLETNINLQKLESLSNSWQNISLLSNPFKPPEVRNTFASDTITNMEADNFQTGTNDISIKHESNNAADYIFESVIEMLDSEIPNVSITYPTDEYKDSTEVFDEDSRSISEEIEEKTWNRGCSNKAKILLKRLNLTVGVRYKGKFYD
jgi:hypothetical protein